MRSVINSIGIGYGGSEGVYFGRGMERVDLSC